MSKINGSWHFNNNITFFDLLGLLFIALKLTHNINWSWIIILAPTLIPLIIMAFLSIIETKHED